MQIRNTIRSDRPLVAIVLAFCSSWVLAGCSSSQNNVESSPADGSLETSSDTQVEASTDSQLEANSDAQVDASSDTQFEASTDSQVDGNPDGPLDALTDSAVSVPDSIPTGSQWLDHFNNEILPFYTSTSALGTPVATGNYPTWRCNSGSIATLSNPCEFTAVGSGDSWIYPDWKAQREFVRTRSRQTFLYGIGYHLTGNETLLKYHLEGVQWILTKGLDPKGGAYSYYDNTVTTPDADPLARSSQDQAYAVLSLALNYYLTRDPAILEKVVQLKDFIFLYYWDNALQLMNWKINLGSETKGNRKFSLVAILDQINAYMLLLQPILPDGPTKTAWDMDLKRGLESMLTNFHDPGLQLFWGEYSSKDEPNKLKNNDHNDFGHTTKAYWQTLRVGLLYNNAQWIDTGRLGAAKTLERAYISDQTVFPDTSGWGGYKYDVAAYQGAWAGQFTGNESTAPNGLKQIYPGTQWWIDAELDQTAAILALDDRLNPSYVGYLSTAYPKFKELRVDPIDFGLYHILERCVPNPPSCPADGRNIKYGKGNLWKGGFHEAEHSLVAYVSSQALRNQPATLYFAWHKNAVNKTAVPYVFQGTAAPEAETALAQYPDYMQSRVAFTNIK